MTMINGREAVPVEIELSGLGYGSSIKVQGEKLQEVTGIDLRVRVSEVPLLTVTRFARGAKVSGVARISSVEAPMEKPAAAAPFNRTPSPLSKEELIALIQRDSVVVIDVEQLNDELYPVDGCRSFAPNGRFVILLKDIANEHA